MSEGKKLPPLEYCTLDRASRLLDCEVSDLLHLAEIGAIELCLKTNGVNTVFFQDFETEKDAKKFERNLHKDYATGVPILYTFELSSANPLPINTDIVINRIENAVYMLRRLHGLWAVQNVNVYGDSIDFSEFEGDTIFELLSKYQSIKIPKRFLYFRPSDYDGDDCLASLSYVWVDKEITSFEDGDISLDEEVTTFEGDDLSLEDDDLSLEDEGIAFGISSVLEQGNEEVEISVSDFWITRKQIQKIINSNGNLLSSWVNGGVLKPENFASPQKRDDKSWVKLARKKGKELRDNGEDLTQDELAQKVEKYMKDEGIFGKGGKVPSADTIKRHALQNLG